MSLLTKVATSDVDGPGDGVVTTRKRRRGFLPFSPWHLLLMPVALLFALPLVQMILTSFMSDADINSFPPKFIPTSLHISGYKGFFGDSLAPRWLLNTVIVATISVVSHLVLCSLAGYGFARLKFRGRNLGFFAIVGTIMIPTQLLMIPTYVMFSKLGLVDTLAAAFVPWLTSAFGIFLMRQFFLSLPRELEEAARIDGCTTCSVFWRIVLPLAKPGARDARDLHAAQLVERPDLAADRDQQPRQLHAPARAGQLPGHPAHAVVAADGRQRGRDDAADHRLPRRAEALRRDDDLQRLERVNDSTSVRSAEPSLPPTARVERLPRRRPGRGTAAASCRRAGR